MISIVIINKNDLSIIDTINGLNRQDYVGKFEILVVDRSTINYPKFKSIIPLRWISYNPKGKKHTIPEQRNVGIKEAKGEIIVFIDANCIPDRDWLTKLVEPIISDGEKIVMGKTGSIGKSTLNEILYKKLANKKYSDEAPTINLAITKDIFEKVGYFDENLEYGSDVDFTWRAVDEGFLIRYQSSAYVIHNWGNLKQELKRTILYGSARTRILIKHFNTRWKNLFSENIPVLLYPILILCLPIAFIFPGYLFIFVLLVLKNIRESNPIIVVINNIIYGYGVLDEVKIQLLNLTRKIVRKIFNLEFTYQFGLALFYTIIYGLAINYLLPIFKINSPLSFQYIWPVYIFYILPIIKLLSEIKNWFSENILSWLVKIVLILNPFVAIMGARFLDNTGNGAIALASVGVVCITFILTFLYKNPKSETLKLSVYSSAISLIFANCLRSKFLVGYDIHQEYLVFRLTNLHNLWNINALRDAYNACLSITILPTIIHNLTNITPLSIFRIVFPLFIALIPVVVFQIGSRMIDKKMAYTGAFLFLLQAQFIAQLPALMRQGIAFIFFALMIDVFIRPNFNQIYRNLVFLIFGIGMILSHYSTTYIALLLLLIAQIIYTIFNQIRPCKEKITAILFTVFSLMFILTFLWNVLITNTAGGLVQTMFKVTKNISKTFSLENKSEFVRAIFYQQSDNSLAVTNYYKRSLTSVVNSERYKGYEIYPVSLNTGKPLLYSDPIPVYFHIIIPWLFRISILIGYLYLLINVFKYRKSPLIISLSFTMFIASLSLILLPNISKDYNFERLFQQMLILLAPISIIGFVTIVKPIKKIAPSILVSIILVSYLFTTTGFIDHLVYKNSTWMFDNLGETFYRYFTSQEEISGMNWLMDNTNQNIQLYADRYTQLRLNAYLNTKFKYVSNQINPPTIGKYGYIFSGLAGTKADVVFAEIYDKKLEFSYPTKYLSITKNMIYSNSITKIYR